jgi:hypothetical protein
MAKQLNAVLSDLEDSLLLKRLGETVVPACKARTAEVVYAIWEKLINSNASGQERDELILDGLTTDEVDLLMPIIKAGSAIIVWQNLPVTRKNKIVDELKRAVNGGR